MSRSFLCKPYPTSDEPALFTELTLGRAALLDLVTIDLPSSTLPRELDDRNAQEALRADSQSPESPTAAVTEETIGRYLAYLVLIGFISPPPARTLPEVRLSEVQLKALRSISGRGAIS